MEVAATSYCAGNNLQRQEVERIMDKYANKIQWRSDGNDAVLDLGSGTGDVTNDLILPLLPPGFKKLVGVDIAEDMVKAANQRYSNTRISFEQWDMCGDLDQLLRRHPEGFDHIFSSFTLHWLQKPELAIKNMYDLLRPNGDCLLIFAGDMDYQYIEDILFAMPKWSKIIKNPKRMAMPYRYFEDPESVVREQLHSVGFKTHSVDTHVNCFTYNSMEEIKRNFGAVNANLANLTPAQYEEYFLDFLDLACKKGTAKWIDYPTNAQYTPKYNLLVVYAQK